MDVPPYYEPGQAADVGNLQKGGQNTLDFLMSSQLQHNLLLIKIVFIVISAIFVFMIIYFISKSEYMKYLFVDDLKNFLFPRNFRKKVMAIKWEKIKKNLNKAGIEAQWKLSLIEALVLIDDNLKQIGYVGETLSDKFKNLTEEDVPNLAQLLAVAKTCQDIVKDPDYKISKDEAEKIFYVLESSLTELEIL